MARQLALCLVCSLLLLVLVAAAPTVLTFGDVRVHLCSEDTARITSSSSAALERAKSSKAVVNGWLSPPAYTMDTTHNSTRITTKRMMIELDVQPGPSPRSIAFYRRSSAAASWVRLLTDIGRISQPVRDFDGSEARQVSAQWHFATTEDALYGGGSHQQNLINYRGAPLQLVQQNTESAVPFFVSRSGFGLLWDCTSEVWLNALEPRVTIDINRTTLRGSVTFVPNITGRYHVTASTGALAWEGSFVPLSASIGDTVLFDWSNDTKNAPPYHTGRAELQAGQPYTLRYDLSGFAAPSDRPSYRDSAELFVTLPSPEDTNGTFSLQAKLEDCVDYYIFAGANIDTSIALYRETTGAAPLYPKWAYGFFQSKNHYKSQAELVAAAEGFRSRNLPLDVVVQDWHYWGADDNWGPVWDPANYPDPSGLTSSLHKELSCRLMVSVWSKFNTPKLLKILQEHGQLIEQQPSNGTVPPPVAAGENWIDIYQPAAASTFFQFVNTTMFSLGVDALWLDATEPSGFPQVNGHVHPRGSPVSGNRFMSSFSLGVTTAVQQGMLDNYPNRRVFSLTRASWAGQQRTGGALWTGDIMASWAALRRQVAASINFGLSGMPIWTQDIGGFHREGASQYNSTDYRRLFTRWFQFGSLTPIFRVHGSDAPNGTEYWLFGAQVTANCNASAALRYRLIPYIYSIAARVQEDGATLQRGLVMDWPTDLRVRDIVDQYMFGPALLVAPITDTSDTRDVYLPQETPPRPFYDFWTGKLMESGTVYSTTAPLSQIPLFGRGGSILVLGPAMQWVDEHEADPVEVRVYRGADATFVLYEDDGMTRNGGNSTIGISWNQDSAALTFGERCGEFKGMLVERTFRVVAVREGQGIGDGDVEAAAAGIVIVKYNGTKIDVALA